MENGLVSVGVPLEHATRKPISEENLLKSLIDWIEAKPVFDEIDGQKAIRLMLGLTIILSEYYDRAILSPNSALDYQLSYMFINLHISSHAFQTVSFERSDVNV